MEIINTHTYRQQDELTLKEISQKLEDEKCVEKTSIFNHVEFFLPSWFMNKTSFCKHEFGCIENVVRSWYKSFLVAFGIKTAISVLPLLFSFKLSKILWRVIGLDNIRFALFAAFMNGSYKAVLCFLRRFENMSEGLRSAIAGFICGLSIAIDSKGRRKTISLLILARTFEVMVNMLQSHGHFKKFKYGELLYLLPTIAFLQFSYAYLPEIMDKGTKNVFKKFSMMTKNDLILREIWMKTGR